MRRVLGKDIREVGGVGHAYRGYFADWSHSFYEGNVMEDLEDVLIIWSC